MEYFNFYHEDFNKNNLNLTDKIILSVISSVGDYSLNYKQLSNITQVETRRIKESLKKLKKDNFIQGKKILTVSEKPIGKYFKVQIDSDLSIKENLILSYIKSTPNQAFFGSLQTLSDVLTLAVSTVVIGLKSLIEKEKIRKDKYKKCYKYTIIETPSEEIIEVKEEETTPNIEQSIPTADVELLNQRLNKASEICKQLMNEIERLKTENETLNKKINSLYERQVKYINLFQPVIERIDEIDSDMNIIFDLTNNQHPKQETELNMNIMRKYSSELV